jgi:hypothetical protein
MITITKVGSLVKIDGIEGHDNVYESISNFQGARMSTDGTQLSLQIGEVNIGFKDLSQFTIGGTVPTNAATVQTALQAVFPSAAPATALPTETVATYAAMTASISSDPTTKRDFFVSAEGVWYRYDGSGSPVEMGGESLIKRHGAIKEGYAAPIGSFTYTRATGLLNSVDLVGFYTRSGYRIWITGGTGTGSTRVTNFNVIPAAAVNGDVSVIYMDVAIPSAATINTGTVNGVLSVGIQGTIPVLADGCERIVIGLSRKVGSGSYDFHSDVLQIYDETGNYKRPFQVVKESIPTSILNMGSYLEGRVVNTGTTSTGFSYDRTTSKLNCTNLLWYYTRGGTRIAIGAGTGVAGNRITDFSVYNPASDVGTCIIYMDIAMPTNAVGATILGGELKSASKDALPVVATGSQRIYFGISSKKADNTYDFYSEKLQIFEETIYAKSLVQILKEDVTALKAGGGVSNFIKVSAPFINKFPNIFSKAPKFKTKYLKQDSDLEVLLLGDSLFALCTSASSITDANPANVPPSCQYNHIIYRLWKAVVKNKPLYDRFDSTQRAFTEGVGTWSNADTKFDTPDWTGEYKQGGSLTRQSSTANAAFTFSWDLAAFEKLNIIHRKANDGVATATITVTQGTGKIQAWDGSTWVEANGFTFSQFIDPLVATDTSGYSQYMANVKLKLRRVATTGTINITVAKGNNASFLYYWGTERWNGYTTFFTNVARAGRVFSVLAQNWKNDVAERKPDLVLFELPLVNELSQYSGSGYQTILNHAQDYIYGDRSGALQANNLKALSNSWQDFEVIAIIPHYRKEYLSGDNFVNYTLDAVNNADSTPFRTYSKVKEMIMTKGDLAVIDMGAMLLNEAKYLGWTYQQAFTTSTQTSDASFTNDNVHPNDLGTYVWSKYLSPIFDFEQ